MSLSALQELSHLLDMEVVEVHRVRRGWRIRFSNGQQVAFRRDARVQDADRLNRTLLDAGRDPSARYLTRAHCGRALKLMREIVHEVPPHSSRRSLPETTSAPMEGAERAL